VSTVRQQHFNLVRGAVNKMTAWRLRAESLRIAARNGKTWKTRYEGAFHAAVTVGSATRWRDVRV
jgi:hypothetical protein